MAPLRRRETRCNARKEQVGDTEKTGANEGLRNNGGLVQGSEGITHDGKDQGSLVTKKAAPFVL